MEADLAFQAKFGDKESKQVGSTAVVVLVIGSQIVCANLGDARAILCRNGRAIDLSVDQKASRKDEQDRIKAEGGYIVFGRVLGRLAVTRAFGDFECKQIKVYNEAKGVEEEKNFVISEPETRMTHLDRQTDDFLLLASDGLFDRFSSQEAVDLAKRKFLENEITE